MTVCASGVRAFVAIGPVPEGERSPMRRSAFWPVRISGLRKRRGRVCSCGEGRCRVACVVGNVEIWRMSATLERVL